MPEEYEEDEFDDTLDEDEIAMHEQEKLSQCWCGAWQCSS